MTIEDHRLYLNYRIILKAKAEGLKTGGSQNKIKKNNFGDNDFHSIYKTAAENEINLLNKLKIKPVRTDSIINYRGRKNLSPNLPQFLHICDRDDLLDTGGILASKIKSAKGIFLTSSRFEGTKIFKAESDILNNLNSYMYDYAGNPKFDFICIGTNSEAEIEFIRKFSGNILLIILPSNPLTNPNLSAINKSSVNFLEISALDPFYKNSKYGFALRNKLAFHLSNEIGILYLSQKSSLSSLIKKFQNAGKKIKIFKSSTIKKSDMNKDTCNITRHNTIRQFILDSLEKENIAIDNLLKLSNIKLNAEEKETAEAISILEMNSEIERCPGGIIKKI